MNCPDNSNGVLYVNGTKIIVPNYRSHQVEHRPAFPANHKWAYEYYFNAPSLGCQPRYGLAFLNPRSFGYPVPYSVGDARGRSNVTAGMCANTRNWGFSARNVYIGDILDVVNGSLRLIIQPTPSNPSPAIPESWILLVNGREIASFSSPPTIGFGGCIPSWYPRRDGGDNPFFFSPPVLGNPHGNPSQPNAPAPPSPTEPNLKNPNDPLQPPWNSNEPPPRIGPPKLKDPPLPKLKKPDDDSDPSDPPKPPDDNKKCCCPELISVSSQIIRSLKNV